MILPIETDCKVFWICFSPDLFLLNFRMCWGENPFRKVGILVTVTWTTSPMYIKLKRDIINITHILVSYILTMKSEYVVMFSKYVTLHLVTITSGRIYLNVTCYRYTFAHEVEHCLIHQ